MCFPAAAIALTSQPHQTHSQTQAHSHCDVSPVLCKQHPGTADEPPSPNSGLY